MHNKGTVESLIKAGAFDSLGHPRKGLWLVFEQIDRDHQLGVAAGVATGIRRLARRRSIGRYTLMLVRDSTHL